MKNEVWLGVPNYPKYSASNFGRVRRGSKILKQSAKIDRKTKRIKRCEIGMKNDAGRTTIKVHGIIAQLFLPRKPSELYSIDHIDRDPTNNRADNLKWATPKEQAVNRRSNRKTFGIKLTMDDVEDMYSLSKTMSFTEIGCAYKLPRGSVFIILKHIHPTY